MPAFGERSGNDCEMSLSQVSLLIFGDLNIFSLVLVSKTIGNLGLIPVQFAHLNKGLNFGRGKQLMRLRTEYSFDCYVPFAASRIFNLKVR